MFRPPPCTPDTLTNERDMICYLCILLPMANMARRQVRAPTHRDQAEGECGPFCHFGLCGPYSGQHHAMAHGDLWKRSTNRLILDSDLVSRQMLGPVSKPSWMNTLGDTFCFGLFLGMPIRPFLDRGFSPPCGLLAAPYLKAHKGPLPIYKSCTLIFDSGAASYPISPRVSFGCWIHSSNNTPMLPIFAISAPRFGCQYPPNSA